MNDWISQIFLFLGVFCTRLKFLLSLFLLLVCKLMAVLDPMSTHLQTTIHFWQLTRVVIEAVHRAARCFKIHSVKLFVQKSVETNLSHSKSLMKRLEHFG